MAYSSFAAFHGTPALYSALPPRQRQRRTATNIMAGYFDRLPALASDSGKDDSSSSRGSVVTITDEEDIPGGVLAGAGRGKNAGQLVKSFASTSQKGVAVKRASESQAGKGKQVRRAVPEEKENTMSDPDTGASLSSLPLSPAPVHANKPKASGFWRAHSGNSSESSTSSTLKRKHSSLFKDDSPSPPPEKPPAKKPRLSESPAGITGSDGLSPSSDSLTSLDSEPIRADTETEIKILKKALAAQYCRMWVRRGVMFCNLCTESYSSHVDMIAHFRLKHPRVISGIENSLASPASPPANPPPPHRKRGQRKNVAPKKGWKGWVEDDLEPQKLILLDKPEVLPERTTRSGRKID